MFVKVIAQQFRKPQGLLGHLAARFMIKTNTEYYIKVIRILAATDNDRVLEIGCGAGTTVRMITEQNRHCHIDALDFSGLMLRKAKRNNRRSIREGRVDLMSGDITHHDFGKRTYTKIFAINVIYFWNDLPRVFKKIMTLLEPGGRVILYMSGPERLRNMPFAPDDIFNKYSIGYVRANLIEAGFSDVHHETVLKTGWETYYIEAKKQGNPD
jgi:SAM-dependent methyltransferase